MDINSEKIEQVAKMIVESKSTYALTGAGISTESGIPDFRGKDGYYTKMDPTKALSRERMLYEPEIFYKEGYVMLKDLYEKKPNDGHKVLAKLESMGLLKGIATQNIDGLDRAAGSKNIYEVHGQTRTAHCLNCGSRVSFDVVVEKVDSGEIPPKCNSCGGTLRSDVVMFGDMMPEDFSRAANDIDGCDLLIVVGSSLVVSPVNYLPRYAKKFVIINGEPTHMDSMAEVVIHDRIGKTLVAILKKVEELSV